MVNKKYINTLDLIETIQNNRKQTLEYINKAKRNIFNSDNIPSTVESYILFRGRTVDDLLLKHSTEPRHRKKNYKKIIQKLQVEDCNILVNKLIWEDQKILCNKINKIVISNVFFISACCVTRDLKFPMKQ